MTQKDSGEALNLINNSKLNRVCVCVCVCVCEVIYKISVYDYVLYTFSQLD